MKNLIVALSFALAACANFAQEAGGQSSAPAASTENKAVEAKPSTNETATVEAVAPGTNVVVAATSPPMVGMALRAVGEALTRGT